MYVCTQRHITLITQTVNDKKTKRWLNVLIKVCPCPISEENERSPQTSDTSPTPDSDPTYTDTPVSQNYKYCIKCDVAIKGTKNQKYNYQKHLKTD